MWLIFDISLLINSILFLLFNFSYRSNKGIFFLVLIDFKISLNFFSTSLSKSFSELLFENKSFLIYLNILIFSYKYLILSHFLHIKNKKSIRDFSRVNEEDISCELLLFLKY